VTNYISARSFCCTSQFLHELKNDMKSGLGPPDVLPNSHVHQLVFPRFYRLLYVREVPRYLDKQATNLSLPVPTYLRKVDLSQTLIYRTRILRFSVPLYPGFTVGTVLKTEFSNRRYAGFKARSASYQITYGGTVFPSVLFLIRGIFTRSLFRCFGSKDISCYSLYCA
jgi:hypothetical protein